MRFKYKAQRSSGEFYEGDREAADKFVLSHELRAEGETLVSASEESVRSSSPFDIKKFLPFIGRISMHERIAFIRNMAGMLAAGLTVSRALAVLERQTKSQKFKTVISGLATRISTGEALSQAFGGYPTVFPPLIVSMIKAGEEGGNLSSALFAVSEQL